MRKRGGVAIVSDETSTFYNMEKALVSFLCEAPSNYFYYPVIRPSQVATYRTAQRVLRCLNPETSIRINPIVVHENETWISGIRNMLDSIYRNGCDVTIFLPRFAMFHMNSVKDLLLQHYLLENEVTLGEWLRGRINVDGNSMWKIILMKMFNRVLSLALGQPDIQMFSPCIVMNTLLGASFVCDLHSYIYEGMKLPPGTELALLLIMSDTKINSVPVNSYLSVEIVNSFEISPLCWLSILLADRSGVMEDGIVDKLERGYARGCSWIRKRSG